jgi:hypothetical protein
MWALVFILIIAGIIVYRNTKNRALRYLLASNVGMYFIYYVATTLNFYAYGWFGNRYNLFLFSLWFTLIFTIVYECLGYINNSRSAILCKFSSYAMALVLIITVLFSVYGVKRIRDHWWKSDLRTVVSEWYNDGGEEIPTFVNFHQRYAFVYYFTHNDEYTEEAWDNVWCNENLESLDYSNDEWISYLEDNVYQEGLPDKIYVVSGQHDTIVNALENYGYSVEPVVDTTAKLFLLTAPKQ